MYTGYYWIFFATLSTLPTFNFTGVPQQTPTDTEGRPCGACEVIDRNYYPIEEAKRSNLRHRPIGLGVQGLADVFLMMSHGCRYRGWLPAELGCLHAFVGEKLRVGSTAYYCKKSYSWKLEVRCFCIKEDRVVQLVQLPVWLCCMRHTCLFVGPCR